jgi:hypothetical protein
MNVFQDHGRCVRAMDAQTGQGWFIEIAAGLVQTGEKSS